MIKFHVDMSIELHQFINPENVKFDCTLLVIKREEVNLWCVLARMRQWSTRINMAGSFRFHLMEGSESIPSQMVKHI
jgi:hypothetical protein